MIYQIVATADTHSEQEVRDNIATVYTSWELEALEKDSERGEWVARLKKDAEFPFQKKDEEKDGESDGADSDSAEDDTDDSEDSSDDDSDSDSSDSDTDGDEGDGDSVDENKKDLVSELNDVIQNAQELLKQLGDKAQEVSDDAQEKDDKIKEIHDTVKDHVNPDSLDELPLDEALPGGPGGAAPPPPGGALRPTRRPAAPRPPGGVKPPGGPSVFTNRKTENVVHPGLNPDGTATTLVKAASELEENEQFADYKVVAMRENPDGSFSATLKLKSK